MANRTLPGYYRGYVIEDGALPDGQDGILIFHQGHGIDYIVGGTLEQGHDLVDSWMDAP